MAQADKYRRFRFQTFDVHQDADGSGSPVDDSSRQDDDAMESEAYARGFEEGRNGIVQREEDNIEAMTAVLGAARERIGHHGHAMARNLGQDMSRLAVAIAGKIIARELRRRPDRLRDILEKTMKLSAGQDNVRLRIHPEDLALVRESMAEICADDDWETRIELISDRNLDRGGCLAETDFGVIDARIGQQLRVIGDALEQAGQHAPRNGGEKADLSGSLKQMHQAVEDSNPIQSCGHVTQVVGLVVEANGPVVQLGSVCDIHGGEGIPPIIAEVLGFRDRTVLMMPLEEIRAIGPGNRVVARSQKASVAVGRRLLGRIIDGLGRPIDGKGPLDTDHDNPLYTQPINPLLRQRIRTPLDMGVRAINGLLTVGCGQRIGIFAGSGVGKSVLMGMIARKSRADVNVIALIGERGRELNDFIEKELGEEGLQKTVVVVATSDHLPLVRVRGAFVATAIAEYFRDQGMHVNLMMDSLTRFAMAQREIGLALGEPPTTKGYTPSVFTLLPKLLERVGTSDHEGTITGLYTVLVEGDDMNEPIADAARSILDGHIVLTRELADHNHYPAIDILRSISRVMEDIASLQHKHSAGRLKELLATYRKAEDMINIGAYVAGSNPTIDRAIAKIDQINGYLRQEIQENVPFDQCLVQLEQIMNQPE